MKTFFITDPHFGHVHASKEYTDFSKQSFCVSVERINYTPIDFEEIKKKMGLQQG